MSTGNPWSAIASGIGSGATIVLKICEYTYALRAVNKQTEEYLIVAQHAWENTKICQRLLSERKHQLPTEEWRDYDRVLQETIFAAKSVALLLEPARVDIKADHRLHFSTRLSWVLADNANIDAALKRLGIVHTSLTQNIATLRLIRPGDMAMLEATKSKDRPPSYELLHWKHQTRLTPKPSCHDMTGSLASPPGTPMFPPDRPQDLPDRFQIPVKRHTSSASTISTIEISPPAELSAGPVPISRPVSRLDEYEDKIFDERGQNGGLSSSMSWLELQSHVQRQTSSVSTISTIEIPPPIELSAGTVPISGPMSRLDEHENRTFDGRGQNGGASSSMSWLERQAMKSSMLRQNRRTAQNP